MDEAYPCRDGLKAFLGDWLQETHCGQQVEVSDCHVAWRD